MTKDEAKRIRVGTKVIFNPNAASHLLYSRCPAVGEKGIVTTVSLKSVWLRPSSSRP